MIVNQIFTKRQTILSYSLKELNQMYAQEQIKIRAVSQHRVRAIKKYILENAEDDNIYFPPVIACVKEGELNGGKPNNFVIIDGSTRMRAFFQIEDMLMKAIKGEKESAVKAGYKLLYTLDKIEIAVQIFEGLSEKEMDQLYIDLNTRGKKVALSKRISYDSRNELNKITNHLLKTNEELKMAGVEMEKTAIVRPSNKNLLTLTQLRQIISIFLTGKFSKHEVDFNVVTTLKMEEVIDLINTFFKELFLLYPAKYIGDAEESMLSNYPLIVAVVLYATKGLLNTSYESRKRIIVERMIKLRQIDWKRSNQQWLEFNGAYKGSKQKYYYLKNTKQNIDLLADWLNKMGR